MDDATLGSPGQRVQEGEVGDPNCGQEPREMGLLQLEGCREGTKNVAEHGTWGGVGGQGLDVTASGDVNMVA